MEDRLDFYDREREGLGRGWRAKFGISVPGGGAQLGEELSDYVRAASVLA
jgi:hypothetical protein